MKQRPHGCIGERKRPGRDSLDDTAGRGDSEPDRITTEEWGEGGTSGAKQQGGGRGGAYKHILIESHDSISAVCFP